jgi:hypothetical protein
VVSYRRSIKARRDVDLALEALGTEGGREVGMEQLEGDETPVLEIAGEVESPADSPV